MEAAVIKRLVVTSLTTMAVYSGTSCLAQSITMSAPVTPTLAAWSERVFNALDDQLKDPYSILNRDAPTGVVSIKFNCSETGAPAHVDLYKSSGSSMLDQETLQAVRRIATLHPLPAGVMHDQRFVVRVLFSNSEAQAERQMKQMRKDAEQSNAWLGKNTSEVTASIQLLPAPDQGG